jgi:hypothetical protein
LYRYNDKSHEPEYKEHEAADHYDGGEEASLGDEPENTEDEQDRERTDGDEVGKVPKMLAMAVQVIVEVEDVPWNSKLKLSLDLYECREYANDTR